MLDRFDDFIRESGFERLPDGAKWQDGDVCWYLAKPLLEMDDDVIRKEISDCICHGWEAGRDPRSDQPATVGWYPPQADEEHPVYLLILRPTATPAEEPPTYRIVTAAEARELHDRVVALVEATPAHVRRSVYKLDELLESAAQRVKYAEGRERIFSGKEPDNEARWILLGGDGGAPPARDREWFLFLLTTMSNPGIAKLHEIASKYYGFQSQKDIAAEAAKRGLPTNPITTQPIWIGKLP